MSMISNLMMNIQKKTKYDIMLDKIKFKAEVPQPQVGINPLLDPPCVFIPGLQNFEKTKLSPLSPIKKSGLLDSMPNQRISNSINSPINKRSQLINSESKIIEKSFDEEGEEQEQDYNKIKNLGYNQLIDNSFSYKNTVHISQRISTDPTQVFKKLYESFDRSHVIQVRSPSHSTNQNPQMISLRRRAQQFILLQQSLKNDDIEEDELYGVSTKNNKEPIKYESVVLPSIISNSPQRSISSYHQKQNEFSSKVKRSIDHSIERKKKITSERDESKLHGYHFDFILDDLSPKRKIERNALENIEKIFEQSLPIKSIEKQNIQTGFFSALQGTIKLREFTQEEASEKEAEEKFKYLDAFQQDKKQLDIALETDYPTKKNMQQFKEDLINCEAGVQFEASARSIKKLKRANLALRQKTRLDREFPIQVMPSCFRKKKNLD